MALDDEQDDFIDDFDVDEQEGYEGVREDDEPVEDDDVESPEEAEESVNPDEEIGRYARRLYESNEAFRKMWDTQNWAPPAPEAPAGSTKAEKQEFRRRWSEMTPDERDELVMNEGHRAFDAFGEDVFERLSPVVDAVKQMQDSLRYLQQQQLEQKYGHALGVMPDSLKRAVSNGSMTMDEALGFIPKEKLQKPNVPGGSGGRGNVQPRVKVSKEDVENPDRLRRRIMRQMGIN